MKDNSFEEYKKTLRKVQLVQLDILKEIDRICKENNISYFLDSGTFLGAVRHNGFIPWDDDLDIGMTRENYVHFLKIANKELDEVYYCLNWNEFSDYGLSYAKVKRKNTLYVENIDKNSKYPEIFVDIFPYDRYPNCHMTKYTQGYPLLLLRVLIKLKAGNLPWAGGNILKKIKYMPAIIVSKLFPSEWMIKKYDRIAQKYNSNLKCEWYFSQGIERYGTWIFHKEWLDKMNDYQFEDRCFPGPANAEAYLSQAYGNYMELPPKEKRWNRHQILEISFDE